MDLTVKGHTLHVPAAAQGAARFSFADLCVLPLGSADFLRLAHEFHTLIIDRIPIMALRTAQRSQALHHPDRCALRQCGEADGVRRSVAALSFTSPIRASSCSNSSARSRDSSRWGRRAISRFRTGRGTIRTPCAPGRSSIPEAHAEKMLQPCCAAFALQNSRHSSHPQKIALRCSADFLLLRCFRLEQRAKRLTGIMYNREGTERMLRSPNTCLSPNRRTR